MSDALSSDCAHRGSALRILQENLHCVRQSRRIVCRDEQAGLTVKDRFDEAADAAGHYCPPRCHRFQRDDTLALLPRRRYDKIRRGEKMCGLRDMTHEEHAIPERRGLML